VVGEELLADQQQQSYNRLTKQHLPLPLLLLILQATVVVATVVVVS
jgi:hypothetical protein